jgi:hypothetical protein
VQAITRARNSRWSASRTVFRGNTYPPIASPDGRLVAFTSVGADSRTLYYLAVDPAEQASIWSVSLTGGPPRLIVRFDDPTREWHRFGFKAGGERFYFTVGDRQSDVWAAEVEASR